MAEPTDRLVDAHRAYLAQRGPCPGRTHVLYIPPGRAPDEVWAEVCIAGRVNGDIDDGGEWHVFQCDGGPDCPCQGIDPAPTYRHFHNGQQVWPPLPATEGDR